MRAPLQFSSSTSSRCYLRHPVASILIAILMFSSLVAQATTHLNSIVLTVQGNIEGQKNDVVELDLESLTKLTATTFKTVQPWTDEANEYTGVRINALLDYIGATTSEFEAAASNEYKFILSDIDFEKYPIIIAYKINGEFLDARKLGPLLIVFPFDDYPELLNEKNKAASVWQLTDMRLL